MTGGDGRDVFVFTGTTHFTGMRHDYAAMLPDAVPLRLQLIAAGVKRVDAIWYTHTHADHFSAAPYLKERLGAPTAIGEKVIGVGMGVQQPFDG